METINLPLYQNALAQELEPEPVMEKAKSDKTNNRERLGRSANGDCTATTSETQIRISTTIHGRRRRNDARPCHLFRITQSHCRSLSCSLHHLSTRQAQLGQKSLAFLQLETWELESPFMSNNRVRQKLSVSFWQQTQFSLCAEVPE